MGGLLNCGLDPLFMFVIMPSNPEVAAALATGIANTIALIYYIILLIIRKKDLVISIKFSKKMFTENIPSEVIKVGIPACLMTLCENISYMILDALIGSVIVIKAESDAALAGIGVAKKINMFAHSSVRGMTQGVLPIIGYNKASGNRKRMAKIVYVSGAISISIALLAMIASMIWATPLSTIFIHENNSIAYATKFLRILCIGGPFSAVALDIPLMFIFFSISKVENNSIGPDLIVWATPITDIVCSLVAVILFYGYVKHNGKNTTSFNEQGKLQSLEG